MSDYLMKGWYRSYKFPPKLQYYIDNDPVFKEPLKIETEEKMTYKEISEDYKENVPAEYQSYQEIYTDLMNLLGAMKERHGLLVLDPEDQKSIMPPRTPKRVLEQIAENIADDDIAFTLFENHIAEIMSRLPEDPKVTIKIGPAWKPKVPWYRRCFFGGCR